MPVFEDCEETRIGTGDAAWLQSVEKGGGGSPQISSRGGGWAHTVKGLSPWNGRPAQESIVSRHQGADHGHRMGGSQTQSPGRASLGGYACWPLAAVSVLSHLSCAAPSWK